MNKKLIALIMAATLVLSLAACRSEDSESMNPTDNIEPTALATEEPTVPGVVILDTPIEHSFEDDGETEETKAPSSNEDDEETEETKNPSSDKDDKEPDETKAPSSGKDDEKKPGETTAPTEGKDETSGNATVPTQPQETTPPTEPEGTTAPSTGDDQESGNTTSVTGYEKYHAMSGAEQKAFIDSFGSIEAFFEWYNAAKAEYEAQNPPIDVGDGNIDIGDIAGGK